MDNITKLKYWKNISECKQQVLFSIRNNKRILMYAPMKGGKTHLSINDIAKELNKDGIRVILVSPVTLLIDQQGERAKLLKLNTWDRYYGKYKGNLETLNIITTPNSLNKVEQVLHDNNDKFILIVDEAHERESSISYRKEFISIDYAGNSKNCICTLEMTATPQNLLRSSIQEYDKYLHLEQLKTDSKGNINPYIFKHGKQFTLKIIDNMKTKTIFNFIESVRKNNPNSYIRIKLDSIKKLEELKKYYKEKEIDFIYLASKTPKEDTEEATIQKVQAMQELRDTIKSYKDIENNNIILGFTALINSGVEINNNDNTIFINFTNDTYNFINEIQSVGRFRNGLKEFILVVRVKEEEQEQATRYKKKFIRPTYEELYKEAQEEAEAGAQAIRVLLRGHNNESNIKELLKVYSAIEIVLNNEIVINEQILKSIANDKYNKCLLEEPKELLKEFKNNSNLVFDNYVIDNKEVSETPKSEEISKKIEEGKQKKKEENKQELKELKEELKELKEESLINILDKLPNTKQEQELINRLENIKEKDETVKKELKSIEDLNISKVQALKIWSTRTKKEIKEMLEANKLSAYNEIYLNDKDTIQALIYKGKKSERKALIKQILSLDYITDNMKNGDRLTKAHLMQLIEIGIIAGAPKYKKYEEEQDENKKKKALETLFKDAQGYFILLTKSKILKENKSNKTFIKYSSIRTDIKDFLGAGENS